MIHDESVQGVPLDRRPAMSQLVRARIATSILFLVDGTAFGTWAALIPSFQHRFALSAGQLSWVLLGIVIGAMVSMPVAGRLAAGYGSARMCSLAGLGFPACLLLLMLAPSFGCLIAAAVVFGACKGQLDISINAQGIAVENGLGRPVISSFNGFWSFGGLAAAATTSLALHCGVGVSLLLGVVALVLMATAFVASRHLLPEERAAAPVAARPGRWALPNQRLLRLAAMAFLALFSEGVLLDWSAVYAHTVAHASLATAPVAFAAFSICMAGGRFTGDLLTAHWGTRTALRLSAALMVTGMAVATLFQTWASTLAGFMIVGFGIANLVPIIFRAAGQAHELGAGPGVAVVSTLGYTGFLSGPPVVGFVAALAGLPVAFCLVIVFGVAIAVVGGRAIGAAPRRPESAAWQGAGGSRAARPCTTT